MPALRDSIMSTLYGTDVWAGFEPTPDTHLTGWNGDHPSLSRLATLDGDHTVVDVGVWKGMSTINMANSMKEAGIDGCVIAVDTFLGSPEHWDSKEFQRTQGHPNLYSIFMTNVHNAGVKDYIVPMAQTSTTAAYILKERQIRPGLVHVDAAHEYEEVLRDSSDYYDILQPGGYLIGDDYHQSWPGVIQAAGELSAAKRLPLTIETPKWIVRKPL